MFPFAGGNSYSFNFIKPHLPKHITPIAIEIPGRGSRIRQPLVTSMDSMAQDALQQIEAKGVDTPCIFWGHSMGALLAFLVIRLLREGNKPLPQHFMVSGREGPSSVKEQETTPLYLQPQEQFFRTLIALGGTPSEVFQHPEMRDLYEPILRADFQALATYQHNPKEALAVPITCIVGDKEKIPRENLKKWDLESAVSCTHITYPGDHFFIFKNTSNLTSLLMELTV
ncbi:MAG: alpha/beta fold hydrolase [Chlamydiales bacterium]|nr:alpha/beta fold hydrolase [Chlamydiales bacterium]